MREWQLPDQVNKSRVLDEGEIKYIKSLLRHHVSVRSIALCYGVPESQIEQYTE